MYYWFNPCCLTVLSITRIPIIKGLQCCKDFFQVTEGICFTATKVIRWNSALWTGSILTTCTKQLFRIVTDKTCQEGMTAVDIAIAESHLNTINSSRFKGLGYPVHTGMVKVRNCSASAGRTVNVLQLCCWEVCKEDLSTA